MQDIETSEQRLVTALLRIGAAAERLAEGVPGRVVQEPDTAAEVENARLTRLLDEARAHNMQLSERLAVMREREQAGQAALEARIGALNAQIDSQGVEVQRLRMVNVQLREAMRSLREALTSGAVEPGQINRALQAELEALQVTRQIESAELDQLLAALDPLVAEAIPESPVAESDDARA